LSIYRTYGLRWLSKHPTPFDFFNTFNTMSGQDLSWFWRTWWYETWTLDQAIGAVTPIADKLSVTIDDRGLAPMPVRLSVTRADGRVERLVIPASVWLTGAKKYTVLARRWSDGAIDRDRSGECVSGRGSCEQQVGSSVTAP
jgi:hypothetical protein